MSGSNVMRNIMTKMLVPNLERDLSRSIGSELASAHQMTDTMLAPHVYGYESTSTKIGTGAFSKTGSRYQSVVKVEFPAPPKGLFNE